MKLISKKEAQKLRTKQVDKSNLEKKKVDIALSQSIKLFNEWKDTKRNDEAEIEQHLQQKITRYNIQIDDLVAFNIKLRQEREKMLIPVEKLLKEAQEKSNIVDNRFKECEKLFEYNQKISKQLNNDINKCIKEEKLLVKRDSSTRKANTMLVKDQEHIRVIKEKLANERIQLTDWKEKEMIKNNDNKDEVRIRSNEIKAQILVNHEQKLQNTRDTAKLISDRQALNSAWQEVNKLKEKYGNRC